MTEVMTETENITEKFLMMETRKETLLSETNAQVIIIPESYIDRRSVTYRDVGRSGQTRLRSQFRTPTRRP